MKKLYIIGNGFDIAHGLKTKYADFRRYLAKYQESFLVELETMYDYPPSGIEDTYLRGAQQDHFLREREEFIIDNLWATIEDRLGYANESEMLSASEVAVSSLDLESGPIAIEDTLNAHWRKQYGFIKELQSNVYKWAKQVRLFNSEPLAAEILDNSNDLFLTFNYTNTLERVYRIPPSNILHIHGGVSNDSRRPVFGHGNKAVIEEYRKLAKEADRVFDEGAKSIYNAIANYYESTFKNTDEIIHLNSRFFQKLQSIECVKVIGHSLSEVDLVYFRKVCNSVDSEAFWVFYYYSDNDKQRFESFINAAGLQGKSALENVKSFWN